MLCCPENGAFTTKGHAFKADRRSKQTDERCLDETGRFGTSE